MLKGAKLSYLFWKEEVHTVVHILNRGLLRKNSDKTPYELCKGRPASVKYFRIFGSKCYIKINEDNLGKFDSRIYEGIFLGYPSNKKSYRCFNFILSKIVASVDVTLRKKMMTQT